jgi:hypothetical protein
VAAPLAAADLTPAQILANVEKTYREGKTFQFEVAEQHPSRKVHLWLTVGTGGQVRLQMDTVPIVPKQTPKAEPGTLDPVTLTERQRAPVEWTPRFRKGVTRVLFVHDGKTFWTYAVSRRQYGRSESPAVSEPVVAGVIETLISRYGQISTAAPVAKLLRQEKVKLGKRKAVCAVIALGERELWVDLDRFLVVRERVVRPGAPEESLTWLTAEVNGPLPADTFSFTPPKKAKEAGR